MNRKHAFLLQACNERGLRVEFDVAVPGFENVVACALLPSLGAPRGTFIFSFDDDIACAHKHLLDLGYTYSVFAAPAPSQEFELKSYVEMFSDWGWAGDEVDRPAWLKE